MHERLVPPPKLNTKFKIYISVTKRSLSRKRIAKERRRAEWRAEGSGNREEDELLEVISTIKKTKKLTCSILDFNIRFFQNFIYFLLNYGV